MKRIFISTLALLTLAAGLRAEPAPAATELTTLLQDFLAGASRNEPALHERFWADDLIYTSAKGVRKSKADILHEVRAEEPPNPGDESALYTGEEIRIQQYGGTAIVAAAAPPAERPAT